MKRPYYLFSSGRLHRKQNTHFLECADAQHTPDDEPEDTGTPGDEAPGEKVRFSVEQVEAICLFGELDIDTKLVTFLAQNSV